MTIEKKQNKTIYRHPILGLPSFFYTANHAIVSISVLLFLLSPAGAQSGSNGSTPPELDPYTYKKFSPSMVVIISVLIAALFFMGFFSVYIRNCSRPVSGRGRGGGRPLSSVGSSMRRRAAAKGLEPAVIETFPTFAYSEVKGLKIGMGALECAVCLNEFEDEETLRLIPKCDHVFHPECIDAWLHSHVTCPVCRANLVPQVQPGDTLLQQLTESHPVLDDSSNPHNQHGDDDHDHVSIRVVEDQLEPPPPPPQLVDRNQSMNRNRPPRSGSVRARLFGKFPRSHSTGHSLVQPGENTDRFTLRLPEDVRKKMMSRTTSCVVVLPRERSSRRGYRIAVGEGSGRGARSFRRLDRAGRSDRWVLSKAPPFFSRAPSVKVVDGVVGPLTTTRETRTVVKLPSFSCLDPKGDDATGLLASDSARPPV